MAAAGTISASKTQATPPRTDSGNALDNRWLVPVVLVLICAACFALRTVWLHDRILGDGAFTLQDNDPWYHYRLLEYQVRNLPRPLEYDPYALWPGGGGVPVGPFFDLVPAAFIRLVGGADPPRRLIELVAAYYAPMLAMGVCLVVFLAVRVLFNRWTALAAALIIAVLPGAYFIRSALGFYDHHVMEVLLSTLLLYLLAVALRRTDAVAAAPYAHATRALRAGWQSDDGEKLIDLPRLRGVLPVSLLAGLVLGCYLLTWIAGIYLLMILFAWLVVQHVCDHLIRRSTVRLSAIMVPCLAVAAVVVLIFPEVASARTQAGALAGGIVLTLLLTGLSSLLQKRRLRPILYPLAVLLMGLAAIAVLNLVAPSLINAVRVDVARLVPDTQARTITEARPILYTHTGRSFELLWKMFALTFPLALVGLLVLAARFIRRRDAGPGLLLVWSVIVLASMFGQIRFAYYAAPVVAILVAFLCHAVVTAAWNFRRAKSEEQTATPSRPRKAICTLLATAVLALAIVPTTGELFTNARFYDGPTDDWREALRWLRDNTPEPFADPDAYYVRATGPDDFAGKADVSGAYGIMSWWDYGYWITGLARRTPNSNPTQAGAVESASFLLAQNEDEACALLDALSARYVLLDWLLVRWQRPGGTRVTGKFSALPVWLDQDLTQYYERVVTTDDRGRRVLRFFYFPPYFQTMCVRLFVFTGQAASPPSPIKVFTLEWMEIERHGRRRVVTAIRTFDTYEQARAFIDAAGDPSQVIASEDPFTTCVPLEPLRRLRLVHQSPTTIARIQGHPVSPVRIFEYTPSQAATSTVSATAPPQ